MPLGIEAGDAIFIGPAMLRQRAYCIRPRLDSSFLKTSVKQGAYRRAHPTKTFGPSGLVLVLFNRCSGPSSLAFFGCFADAAQTWDAHCEWGFDHHVFAGF